MRPTQGAEQRLIWYCRQGRVRVWKMLSAQDHGEGAQQRAEGLIALAGQGPVSHIKGVMSVPLLAGAMT